MAPSSFWLAVCLLIIAAAAAEKETPHESELPTQHTREELFGMRIRELSGILKHRRIECRACTEKEHFVDRILETQHMPIKQRPPAEISEQEKQNILKQLKKKQEENQRLKQMLKDQGIPGAENMNFGGNNMDPDQMASILSKLDINNVKVATGNSGKKSEDHDEL